MIYNTDELKEMFRNWRAPDSLVENNTYIDNWDLYFFKFANLAARKSKDCSSQVGAVIVKERRILSTGFNGFPMGVVDSTDRYSDRDAKLSYICHAEFNSCIVAGRFGIDLSDSTLYTQAVPCENCCKAVIQVGVSKVFFLANCQKIWDNHQNWGKSAELTRTMFAESGVELRGFDFVCGDKIKIGGKIYDI